MKVVVVGPGPKFLSGISYFTWKLVTTLEATPILFRDMMPKFLFPGKDIVGEVENKIKYEPYGLFLDWWNPVTWIRAVQECNRHDVVILEWWSVSVAHMYAFIALFCRQRIIVEVHELIDPMESNRTLLRAYGKVMWWIVWGRAERIVVHSQHDRSLLMNICSNSSIEIKSISIIPHVVYDQYGKSAEKWFDRFDVVFFGLVRDYKGVKYLLDGFKKANFDPFISRLFIFGEQWDKIEDKDHWLNVYINDQYKGDTQIEQIFTNADVVVLPYLRASSSGVAHIAIHYGLPIIATPVGRPK